MFPKQFEEGLLDGDMLAFSSCAAVYRLLLNYRNLVNNWITAPVGSVAFTGQLRYAIRSIHSFYIICLIIHFPFAHRINCFKTHISSIINKVHKIN